MEIDVLDPCGGGGTSVDRPGSEPLCSFDPEAGFSLNPSTRDELRYFTYLGPPDLEDESLLESRNDD